MKAQQVKDFFKLCFESSVTPCLIGESGTGKTTIPTQIYKELGFDDYVIFRPALCADSADLTGLPEFEVVEFSENGVQKTAKTTAFASPRWLPRGDAKILVILDEFNRATKDLANGLFGLIEAESPHVGEYKLGKGSKVVATGNPPTDNYGGVLDLSDNAWTSRLCFAKMEVSLDEYIEYGKSSGKVSTGMQQFLLKNPKFYSSGSDFEVDEFFGSNSDEINSYVTTNNRSKNKIDALYTNGIKSKVDESIIFEAIRGIAGKEFAVAYTQFQKVFNTTVTLEEILEDQKNLERFDYTALSNISKVIDDLTNKLETGTIKNTKKHRENLVAFLTEVPIDTLQGFIMDFLTYELKDEMKKNKKFISDTYSALIEDKDILEKITAAAKLREESEKSNLDETNV